MEMSFGSRLKHAWNAFTGNVQTNYRDLGICSLVWLMIALSISV